MILRITQGCSQKVGRGNKEEGNERTNRKVFMKAHYVQNKNPFYTCGAQTCQRHYGLTAEGQI